MISNPENLTNYTIASNILTSSFRIPLSNGAKINIQNGSNDTAGYLEIKDNKLYFDGNIDESAKYFIEMVNILNQYIPK